MNTQYVVVVEVDNKRALAAYQKGLADLDLIWPQLMEHAQKIDAERRKTYEAEQTKKRLEREREEAARENYKKQMREWEEKKIFRGEPPRYPWPSYEGLSDYFPPSYLRDSYVSARMELQNMANLAGAAIAPFRMTEGQVHRMVEWENGNAIERMKEGMSERLARTRNVENNSYTLPT
jgi:hypothetical protein